MGYDIGRAALACLLVLTVVFAASLFPATGLGGFPGGIGDSSAPAAGGDTGGAGADGQGSGPATATEATSTSTDEGGDGEGSAETETGAETEEATETRTQTRTETPDDSDEDSVAAGDDEGDGLEAIAAVVGALAFALLGTVVLGGTVLVIGSVTGALVVGTTATGVAFVEIFGYRVNVGRNLQGLSRASMGFVFAFSSATGRLLSGIGDLATSVPSGMAALGRGGVALASIPAAIGRGLAGLGKGLGALFTLPSVGSLFSGVGLPGLGWSRERTPDADARSLASPSDDATDDGEYRRPPPQNVPEVWERFVEMVPLRNPRARTPGEYARYAVGRGYPADAVGQLTRTFREVRYGERPGSGERFERARAAWEHLREWTDDDEEEDDS